MVLPQRKLHRLASWDYSQPGYYYVTICTKDKKKLLSRITPKATQVQADLTKTGQIVKNAWERIENTYPGVKLDYYCIMPNHLHGILVLEEGVISLSDIIRGFKSVTTREFNKNCPEEMKNTLWQSSFYDEIIRNDEMLYDVRKYIFGNPSKWVEDSLFVE